ncbi:sigma-E factor negative regulatory protein [soil metagenome]
MSQASDQESRKLQLSSLVDGEVAASDMAGLCAEWSSEAHSRRTWHTYQLIGDALRSEELATDPARDCDFLAKLRLRLADEPVVLAPQSVAEPVFAEADAYAARTVRGAAGAGGRSSLAAARRWRMPMTVAASVLAVSGVLMVARVSGMLPFDSAAPTTLAQQTPARGSQSSRVAAVAQPIQPGIQTVSTQTLSQQSSPDSVRGGLSAVQPQTLIANGQLIRDARLDQYLAAHKQFGGSTALGVPSGFLRSATSEGRDR